MIDTIDMGKTKKVTGNHHKLQVVTLCISTTMVLVLLGLAVFFAFTARNLSSYVKENLTVTVMLSDSTTNRQIVRMHNAWKKKPYTHRITYVSKEQAKKEQAEAMGSDPSEFLGFNPFTPTFEINLHADYANCDSLKWIEKELRANTCVSDVAYQEDLMDKVNDNLRKVMTLLLVLAALLTFVSFSLISNSIRLSIYSRRFLIHTMTLVGASWGFIRRPFMMSALTVGLFASLFACMVIGAGVYAWYNYDPVILAVVTWDVLVITAAAVFLFGVIITMVCSYFTVNHYLKMKSGELYKI